ncbi:MAG: hypothetical protein PF442_00565, partial [Desulfobulbaceae bacterium]|nr:hypothetical protein [Desulfobulbaceae bacterium]
PLKTPMSLLKNILTFEFNDSPRCPDFIRESILEVLGASIRDAGVYDRLAPRFIECCTEGGIREVLGIGAGSGESTAVFLDAVLQTVHTPPHIYISDLLPMVRVMAETCNRYPDLMTPIHHPVDIRNPSVAPDHDMRMVLSAFHHFDRELAATFLHDAREQKVAVFIAEPFTRSLKAFLPLFLHGFTSLARNGIFSTKMRLAKFIFTFLIPLIPLCLLWDGLVSMMRMYTEEEFMEMVAALPESDQSYQWQYEEVQVPLGGTASLFTGRVV